MDSTRLTSFAELDSAIAQAMRADRFRLRQRLRSIRQVQRAGKPFDRNLARLTEDVQRSRARRDARANSAPKPTFDNDLPVSAKRAEIAEAIRRHQVVIVSGETGSGKSTQLPKICLELGRGIEGLIGHTQPRRIAARSVAARIAEELGSPLGRAVGYKVRFTDETGPETHIKLMTDGILLAESQRDRFLDQYDTLIIDEAHERSLNIDFLLGYLKRLLPRRPDLKIIITSATLDAERFSEHFATRGAGFQPAIIDAQERQAGDLPHVNAPIIEVTGRTYPVEVRYRPTIAEEGQEPDWMQGIVDAVDELAVIDSGDMLIFLPTERDIHELAKLLRGHRLPGDEKPRQTEILPLYARLSATEQNRVFQAHSQRRIVLATNVAESSLTVPGIRFVIDPGTARISRYSARSKMQRLPVEPISQASADQRKGRCGRIGPGVCVRLYSEEDYLARDRYTTPEIQRTNLASVILQTKALNFGEIEEFPFLDPPKADAIRDGYKTLFELGAIDEQHAITKLGRELSRLPVDPRVGRMILAANREDCLHEVLMIAAALEIQDPRERPRDKQRQADEAHARFAQEESDFLSYLKLWDHYHQLKRESSRKQLAQKCREQFLSPNRLREWADVHRQLAELVREIGLKPGKRRDDYNAIHRALLTGLLSNVALRTSVHEYTVAGGNKVQLWPGSSLFTKKPRWIVAAEVVETTRRYVRTVARINSGWIESLAPHLVHRSYSDPYWDSRGATPMIYEKVSLLGLVITPRRPVRYGLVNPADAREMFIQHALVEGDFRTDAPFFRHNRQLLADLHALQAKTRRHGLLRPTEARFEFYDRRVPADVQDGKRFQIWRRMAERQNPQLLFLSPSDLLTQAAEAVKPSDYPDTLSIRQMRLPLSYEYDPGADEDGITVTVPIEGLNQLDAARLTWLVPGLREEKIVALIKSLPKGLRTQFVPVPDTAKQVSAELKTDGVSFEEAVAVVLRRISGEEVPVAAFQVDKLPDNLRMNIRVVDPHGKTVALGRDLTRIRRQIGAEAAALFTETANAEWHRDGLTAWDFGDLPARIDVRRGGIALKGYPSLVDQGDSVSLRLRDAPEQAVVETRAGLRRLFYLATKRELKELIEWLPGLNELSLYAATLSGAGRLKQALAELVADRAFLGNDAYPRTAAEFEQRLSTGRERIGPALQDVLAVITPLLQAHHRAKLALEEATNPLWQPALDNIQHQLTHLTAPGFLTATPWGWLMQYPRYLRAIEARLDRIRRGGFSRDQEKQAELAPRWQAYLARARRHQEQGVFDPELVTYRWMFEEYRVSLFAQELGTAVPISEKRLDQQGRKVRF